MPDQNDKQTQAALTALRQVMESYYPLSDATWSALSVHCKCRAVDKGELLYATGLLPASFSFVYQGLFRIFITDSKGNEYNKMFFEEGRFPGSMGALLTGTPSLFSVEALEPSLIVEIAFKPFRQLLQDRHDLALFQIHYLEASWLLDKEPREVSLVQEDASQRYRRFLEENPGLSSRVPQYHIASHLGITPTQLSRIRKARD